LEKRHFFTNPKFFSQMKTALFLLAGAVLLAFQSCRNGSASNDGSFYTTLNQHLGSNRSMRAHIQSDLGKECGVLYRMKMANFISYREDGSQFEYYLESASIYFDDKEDGRKLQLFVQSDKMIPEEFPAGFGTYDQPNGEEVSFNWARNGSVIRADELGLTIHFDVLVKDSTELKAIGEDGIFGREILSDKGNPYRCQ